MATTPPAKWKNLSVKDGMVYVYQVFDVAHAINLERADQLITAEKARTKVHAKKRSSQYFDITPVPIRVTYVYPTMSLTPQFKTSDIVEAVLFDFGAISVTFRIPVSGPFINLVTLSEAVYGNLPLRDHALGVVKQLLGDIEPATTRLNIADHSEDYVVYHLARFESEIKVADLAKNYPDAVAALLRGETLSLAQQEIENVISQRISYTEDDIAVVDWNGALIFDESAEEICAILEFANVALLEFSYLDLQLDKALDEFYEYFTRPRRGFTLGLKSRKSLLRRISNFLMDSATLFEGVSNSLKLLGDEYLARAYRLASKQLGLPGWDASISRKLKIVESMYDKISDEGATQRLELLEWIIILLITLSIVLSFYPGYS